MIDFSRSTLLISARSPFARRVRLALREHGIAHEERVFDVFKPNADLIAVNPIARVPSIRFSSGETLFESEKILTAFYRSFPESPLSPRTDQEWLAAASWSALALGLCEKTVEYFLEMMRVESSRDGELLQEVQGIALRVLDRVEAEIGNRNYVIDGRLTQSDLDMGSALAYFTLRYPLDWQSQFPNAARYLHALEERQSFRDTRPLSA